MTGTPRGSRARRLVGAVLVAALAAGPMVAVASAPSAGADGAPDCTPTSKLENPCRPWFGANVNLYPGITAGSLDQYLYFEQRTNRQMDVAHTFHAVGSTTANQLSTTDQYFISRPDTLLYTNWALTNDFDTATGSDAAVNQQIDQMAASIKAVAPARIFLALHHEPENDLDTNPAGCGFTATGTSGTADEYRAMWANVRARFDAAGVDNVVWVMNYMGYPKYDCTVDALWPGDDLVDWVTYTGYEDSDVGVSFDEEVGTFYDLLTDHSAPGHDYLSKPWGIAEWGIYNSSQENAYLYYRQARAAVEANRFPRLRMYLVYDNADQAKNLYDYQVSYGRNRTLDPLEQAWFNQYADSWALTGDGALDPELPTVPAGAGVSLDAGGRPVVVWTGSEDDEGAVTYDVLRDGTKVATTSSPRYVDAGVAAGSHFYQVRAVGPTGAVSALSDPVVITAPAPDTTPPSVPGGLAVALVDGKPTLSWSPATDDRGVTGYDVYRGAAMIATTTSTDYVDTSAPAGATSYTVVARDGSDNVSDPAPAVTVDVPDATAPTRPTGLRVTLVRGAPSLTWNASTDAVGVSGYDVLRGGTVVATVTGRQYADASAPQGRTSTYSVRARDAAGNVSPASSSVSVRVPDTTAPIGPGSLTVSRSGTRATLRWTAATDNVAVTAYWVYRGGTRIAALGANARSTTATGLTARQRYTFRVVARDAAGNQSPGVTATG